MNTKEILWSVLEKYDNCSKYEKFCNSISNLIQEKENSLDILNIYISLSEVDTIDKEKIDYTLGSKIDSFLFSM